TGSPGGPTSSNEAAWVRISAITSLSRCKGLAALSAAAVLSVNWNSVRRVRFVSSCEENFLIVAGLIAQLDGVVPLVTFGSRWTFGDYKSHEFRVVMFETGGV